MSKRSEFKLPGTSRQAEEQHLQETLSIVRDNVEKYSKEVASLRSGIDDMLTHFHDDNPELINELENTYTMYHFLDKTLDQNLRALKKPYFGRIDILDEKIRKPETFYIGRSGISRDVIHPVVVDWRSPVANTYYENGLGSCSYRSPDGSDIQIDLKLKRTYEIENGTLQNIFDTEVIANDDILTRYLSRNKQSVLGEIVATIQKEQNEIIRKSPYHNCIVQGVAGSGKTTVAMHRISYILYNYEERFRPEDFYIVGSNRMLLNYITGVLPDLDVYGVRQMTMEQLFVRLLYEDWDENRFSVRTMSAAHTDTIHKGQLSWFRSLEAFCRRLEKKSIARDSIYLNPKQFVEGIVDGKTGVHDKTYGQPADPNDLVLLMDGSAIRRYLSQNRSVSIQSKINMLNDRLHIRVKDEFLGKDVHYTDAERKAITRHFHGRFGSNTWKTSIFDLYREFLQEQMQKGISVDILETEFDVYDLAALAYLYKRVKETEVISEAHHIVIDEAQDFGMMVYSVLKFCVKDCTYTIMGDVSQNIHFGCGLNDWEELKQLYLPDERSSFSVLKKSYRNTVEISDFATRILHHGSFAVYPIEPIIRHGSEPRILSCKNPDLYMKRVAELCEKWKNSGLDTIAVICRDQASADRVTRELSPFIPLLENSPEKASFGSGVMVLPVEYTKGLEFDAVLLLDPSRDDYPVDDGHAKLLYVAATRALHELCILHTGNLTGLIADPIPKKTVTIIETPISEDNETSNKDTQITTALSKKPETKAADSPAAAVVPEKLPAKNNTFVSEKLPTKHNAFVPERRESEKTTLHAQAAANIRQIRRLSAAEREQNALPKIPPATLEIPFGTSPSNELLRPVGHAISDQSIRWITKQPDGLCLHSNYGTLCIRPLRGDAIRITFSKGNQPPEYSELIKSADEPFRKWKYRESSKLVEIKTEKLYLKADRSTGAITFMTAEQKLLLEERSRECRLIESTPHGGVRTRLYLNWPKNEKLYALGAGTKAELSLTGTARYISHRKALSKPAMVVSEKGYGIMLASDESVFCCDIGTYGPHICMEHKDVLDYCLIAGKDAKELLAVYDTLRK